MVSGCPPKKPIFEKKKRNIFCGLHFNKNEDESNLDDDVVASGSIRWTNKRNASFLRLCFCILGSGTWVIHFSPVGHMGYHTCDFSPWKKWELWLNRYAYCAEDVIMISFEISYSVTSDVWSSKELWICASGNGPRNVAVNAESPKNCVCVCFV